VKQIRQRLTYANVMSSFAVFLVLGGATAFAATKIGANELKANSVLTGKIKKEAVTTSKLKNSAVNTSKLGAGAVTSDKLADNAVTTTKIANKAVTAAKIDTAGLTVPNAVSAVNAQKAQTASTVDGVGIQKFSVKVPNGGGPTPVITVGGVTLTGACPGGTPEFIATKEAGAPSMAVTVAAFNTGADELKTTGVSSFSTVDLDQGFVTLGGQLVVTTTTGSSTTFNYLARDSGNFSPSEAVCVFAGTAVSG
jgi:hypothetical protein